MKKLLLALVVVWLMLAMPVMAEPVPKIDVTLDVTEAQVIEGEVFEVDILVDAEKKVSGMQLDLSYDPSILRCESVAEGDFLSNQGYSTVFSGGTIDNTMGLVNDIYGVTIGSSSYAIGAGTFATITFTALGVGESQQIIENAIVANSGGQAYEGVICLPGLAVISSSTSNILLEVVPSAAGTIYNYPYVRGAPLVTEYEIGETASYICMNNMGYHFVYWDLDDEVVGEYYYGIIEFEVTQSIHNLKAVCQANP